MGREKEREYVCVWVSVGDTFPPKQKNCKVYVWVSERKWVQKKLKTYCSHTSSSINALLVWSVVISLVYKSVCDDDNYCNIKSRKKRCKKEKKNIIRSRYCQEDQHRKIKETWRRRDVILFLILLDMLKRNSFLQAETLCFLPTSQSPLFPPPFLPFPSSLYIFYRNINSVCLCFANWTAFCRIWRDTHKYEWVNGRNQERENAIKKSERKMQQKEIKEKSTLK